MRTALFALLAACATAPARPTGQSDADVSGTWELYTCDDAPCTRERSQSLLVVVLLNEPINLGGAPVYGRSAEERTGPPNGCVAELEGSVKRDGAAVRWAREGGLITFVPAQWVLSETIISARFAGGTVSGVSEWSSRKRGDERRRVQHVAGRRIGPVDRSPCDLVPERRPIP